MITRQNPIKHPWMPWTYGAHTSRGARPRAWHQLAITAARKGRFPGKGSSCSPSTSSPINMINIVCWRLLKSMSCDATWFIQQMVTPLQTHVRSRQCTEDIWRLRNLRRPQLIALTCTTQMELRALSWHMISSTDNDLTQRWTVNTQQCCSNWQNAQDCSSTFKHVQLMFKCSKAYSR